MPMRNATCQTLRAFDRSKVRPDFCPKTKKGAARPPKRKKGPKGPMKCGSALHERDALSSRSLALQYFRRRRA